MKRVFRFLLYCLLIILIVFEFSVVGVTKFQTNYILETSKQSHIPHSEKKGKHSRQANPNP